MAKLSAESADKFRRGEISLTQLFDIDSKQIASLILTGQTLFEQGRLEEAKSIFEGLAALDGRNPYVQGILGAIDQKQQKWDRAIIHYTMAIRLYPGDIDSLVNRGEILLGLAQFEKAAADFKKAIDLDPNRERPAANRARLLVALIKETSDMLAQGGMDAIRRTREAIDQQRTASKEVL